MSAVTNVLALLLVALTIHVGILIVSIFRAILPSRRDPTRVLATAAAALALLGELLVLGTFIGWLPPPAWILGILGLATLLSILARPTWQTHAAGRAARQALYAAPLVLATVIVLTFR